jgi:hypothetical protein
VEEDSEELESEDEDGEELTPGVDAAILRTLAKIRRGDPEIYDKEKAIFEGRLFGLFESKNISSHRIEEQKRSGQSAPSKSKIRKDKVARILCHG